MAHRRAAAVAGIGRTAFTRKSGRTTLALGVEACLAALADAGLAPSDVDGIATYHMGESADPLRVAHATGVDELSWFLPLGTGGNVVASAVATAAAAIAAGLCRVVLVYRALNGRSGHRFGTDTPPVVGGELQFDAPAGYLLPPQWMAMAARRHQHVYGSSCEDLGRIAITQRTHAADNPHAIARAPLSMSDYMDGRWVAEPLRVYDCAYEVDGGVALVVVGAAQAESLRQRPAWLVGASDSMAKTSWNDWDDLTTMYSRTAAPRLWERTGLSPADIDLACLYDCFTYTVMVTLEDFGFCAKGAAGSYFAEGRATHGGDVVVNPHGGLLSEGYLHGLNHFYEAVLQLRGQAGVRQVEDARLALVTAGTGSHGGAVVLGSDRP